MQFWPTVESATVWPTSSFLSLSSSSSSLHSMQWINLRRLIAASGRHCVCVCICYVSPRSDCVSAKLRHATHRITHGLLFIRRLPATAAAAAGPSLAPLQALLLPLSQSINLCRSDSVWLTRSILKAATSALQTLLADEVVKRRENRQGQSGLCVLICCPNLHYRSFGLVIISCCQWGQQQQQTDPLLIHWGQFTLGNWQQWSI